MLRRSAFTLTALFLAACTEASPIADGGSDAAVDGAWVCARDAECSDGLFCDGIERCAPADTAADSHGCAPAPSASTPCPADQTCDELNDACAACMPTTRDLDGDGHASTACGGDDCDDTDVNRYLGNVEDCDTLGHDEDCNPTTYGPSDRDHDSYDDVLCCNGTICGNDCDDNDSSVHPDATEACNGYDDNCDGMSDEGVLVSYFTDFDNDSYGDVLAGMGCTVPSGNATRGGDCADSDDARHPTATEACNGLDDDCNGVIDEGTAALCAAALGSHGPAACMPTATGAACRPTDCAMGFADCDGNAANGCEVNTCNAVGHCNHCGAGGGCECSGGVCFDLSPVVSVMGTVSNVGGAGLAGAVVRPLFGCNDESATTDALGGFTLSLGVAAPDLYRVDATGHRTHVDLSGDFDVIRPMTLRTWLADADAPAEDPTRGIVVLEIGSGVGVGGWTVDGPGAVGQLVVGTDVLAPGASPSTGLVTTMVFFNVAPGPLRIAPVVSFGCGNSCSPVRTWVLPGAVTRVTLTECRDFCG